MQKNLLHNIISFLIFPSIYARMKTVITNIWMLLLRLALLALFVYMYQWPLGKIQTGEYRGEPVFFIVGILAFSMFPLYILWTLFGVLRVTFSEDGTIMYFHHFYKTVSVTKNYIDGYFRTTQNTKVNTFKGLLIKLKNGEVIEVTEYNLQSLSSINNFLRENKIPLRGDKSSWFPLKRRL